jgi:hypothetical protein
LGTFEENKRDRELAEKIGEAVGKNFDKVTKNLETNRVEAQMQHEERLYFESLSPAAKETYLADQERANERMRLSQEFMQRWEAQESQARYLKGDNFGHKRALLRNIKWFAVALGLVFGYVSYTALSMNTNAALQISAWIVSPIAAIFVWRFSYHVVKNLAENSQTRRANNRAAEFEKYEQEKALAKKLIEDD